jgi:hypothetical protein
LAPAIGPYDMVGIDLDTKIIYFSVDAFPPYRAYKFSTSYANLAEFFAERLNKISRLNTIRVYTAILPELRSLYPDIAPLFPDVPEIPAEVAEEEIWLIQRSV